MMRHAASLVRRVRRIARSMTTAEAQPSPASPMEVERAEWIFYLEYLRDGMTIFDAGANVGELTLLFSRSNVTGGSVQAFEPCAAS